MRIEWEASISRVHIFGRSGKAGFGIDLGLTNVDGGELTEVVPIIPVDTGSGEPDGTMTIPLRLERPLTWLDLPTGKSSSGITKDGRYALTLNRAAANEWTLTVDDAPGGPDPHPEMSRMSATLTTDVTRPPWGVLTMDFEAHASTGRASARLELRRI
jgi:hypothetical protein